MDDNLHNLEKELGYEFNNLDLLKEALTHKSFVAEYDSAVRDNQRLEYLGDAVVQIVTTTKLYSEFPDSEEGDLTKIRATLTREESLASFARELNVGEFLRLGNGEDRSNGRDRSSNLCDAFEAIVGAIYLDAGHRLEPVQTLVDLLVGELENNTQVLLANENPKGELQEWAQRTYHVKPVYETLDESGPDHDKTFTVSVTIADKEYGQGMAGRLRTAEQEAARKALRTISEDE